MYHLKYIAISKFQKGGIRERERKRERVREKIWSGLEKIERDTQTKVEYGRLRKLENSKKRETAVNEKFVAKSEL